MFVYAPHADKVNGFFVVTWGLSSLQEEKTRFMAKLMTSKPKNWNEECWEQEQQQQKTTSRNEQNECGESGKLVLNTSTTKYNNNKIIITIISTVRSLSSIWFSQFLFGMVVFTLVAVVVCCFSIRIARLKCLTLISKESSVGK